LSFDESILAFSGLATVLATISQIWAIFFPNLLVTLLASFWLVQETIHS
jgi:hypothetical protein